MNDKQFEVSRENDKPFFIIKLDDKPFSALSKSIEVVLIKSLTFLGACPLEGPWISRLCILGRKSNVEYQKRLSEIRNEVMKHKNQNVENKDRFQEISNEIMKHTMWKTMLKGSFQSFN